MPTDFDLLGKSHRCTPCLGCAPVLISGGQRDLSLISQSSLSDGGHHGAVDAAVPAALRSDAVAAGDVQSQVRFVGAHDHRRWIRLLPPLPATPHRAFPLLGPCCF